MVKKSCEERLARPLTLTRVQSPSTGPLTWLVTRWSEGVKLRRHIERRRATFLPDNEVRGAGQDSCSIMAPSVTSAMSGPPFTVLPNATNGGASGLGPACAAPNTHSPAHGSSLMVALTSSLHKLGRWRPMQLKVQAIKGKSFQERLYISNQAV